MTGGPYGSGYLADCTMGVDSSSSSKLLCDLDSGDCKSCLAVENSLVFDAGGSGFITAVSSYFEPLQQHHMIKMSKRRAVAETATGKINSMPI